MSRHLWSFIVALVAFGCLASTASGQAQSPDGLVQVKPRQMELAWLRPGADFRPYTKVNISRTQVAFRPNWMKDYNLNSGGVGNWVTQDDANRIMAAAQTNFDDVFVDAFKKAGYEVVTTTGPDVLRVNSGVLDLSVNAPKGTDGRTTWIITAGEAALIVEVRDTVTNALARARRGQARDAGPRPSDSEPGDQHLRFSPALQPLVGDLREGPRRTEGHFADTRPPDSDAKPLNGRGD